MKNVLVIDVTTDASPLIPYLFREANCRVDIFCYKLSVLAKHRFYDHWYEVPQINEELFLNCMYELLQSANYDWILPANDKTNRFLNEKITDENIALMILPVSRIESRVMLGSKAGLALLCKTHDILSPDSEIYSDAISPLALVDKLHFPILLKENFSSSGRGIVLCRNKNDVLSAISSMSQSQKNNLVMQNYISGRTVSVEAIFRKGHLLGYANSYFISTVKNEFGISIRRLYSAHNNVEKELSVIGDKLAIDGFSTMTFIEENKSNKLYLIEADLRPQVWFRYAKWCSVDFSKVISNYMSDSEECIKPKFSSHKPEVTMWHLFRMIRNCSSLDLKLSEMLKWLFNIEGRWRFVNWYGWRYSFRGLLKLISGAP